MSITRSGDPASARAAASASASGTAKTTTTAKAPTPAATPSAPPELAPAPVLAPAPTPTPVAAPAAPAQPAQPAQKRKYTRRAPAKPRGRAGKAAPSTRPTSKIEALGAAVRPGPALLPGAEAPAAAAAVLSLSPSAALVRSRAVAFELSRQVDEIEMSNALCQIIQAQMAAGEKVEGLDKELEVARVRKNTALKAIGPMLHLALTLAKMKHYAPLDGRIVATSNAINAVVAGKMPFSTLGLPIE